MARQKEKKSVYVTMKRVSSTYNTNYGREKDREKKNKNETLSTGAQKMRARFQ
jgi:hypothetical protein